MKILRWSEDTSIMADISSHENECIWISSRPGQAAEMAYSMAGAVE